MARDEIMRIQERGRIHVVLGVSQEALADIKEAERMVICEGCGLWHPAGQRCEICGHEDEEVS